MSFPFTGFSSVPVFNGTALFPVVERNGSQQKIGTAFIGRFQTDPDCELNILQFVQIRSSAFGFVVLRLEILCKKDAALPEIRGG